MSAPASAELVGSEANQLAVAGQENYVILVDQRPDGGVYVLIQLDRQSKLPLYLQISRYVRRLIETDMLKPGVKLPATRELAADLGVDRATIVAAYEELVAQG